MQLLIAAKARLENQDQCSHSALIPVVAAAYDHTECVQLLVDAKAGLDFKSDEGDTALIKAASEEHTECVQLLVNANADVNAKDDKGVTALDSVR